MATRLGGPTLDSLRRRYGVRVVSASLALASLWIVAPPAVARAQAGIPYLAEPDRQPVKTNPPPTKTPAKGVDTPPADAGGTVVPAAPAVPRAPAAPAVPSEPTNRLTPEPTTGKPFSFFAELWARRRAALRRGDDHEASQILQALVDAKTTAGWPDIFAYGDALVQEAEAALASGKATAAFALATGAVELAPHRPEAYFVRGHAAWMSPDSSLGVVLDAYSQGLSVTLSEPPLVRVHLGNLLLSFAAAALVVACILTLISLYRHSRLLFHDLQHVLPRGTIRAQTVLLGIGLLLIPIFFRLGAAWSILIWLVLLSVYHDARERAGAILTIAGLAAFAFSLPWLTSHLDYAGSRSQDVYLTVRDAGASAAAERVHLRQHLGPDELYALGLRARWSGQIEEARGWLDRAAATLSDEDLFITAGNVRCLAGDRPGAIAAYERALRLNPHSLAALFNLSRVYYALTEHQKAGEAQRRAMSLDLERVEHLNDEAKRTTGIYLVDSGVPRRLLTVSLDLGREHSRAVMQLWSIVGAETTRLSFGVAAIVGCFVVLLLGLLRRVLHPAKLCSRCGMAACRRCHNEMPDQTQCGQCYHVFVALERVDPRQCIRKEIQVHRYRARQTRLRQVLSVLLAGGGQILRGAFLSGMLLMIGYLTLGIALLRAFDVLPEIVCADGGPRWLWMGLAVVGMMVIYIVALVDGLREDR